jgi:hypothetical protein
MHILFVTVQMPCLSLRSRDERVDLPQNAGVYVLRSCAATPSVLVRLGRRRTACEQIIFSMP